MYEEKFIKSTLCFRTSQHSDFTPCNTLQLAKRIKLAELDKTLVYSKHDVIVLLNKLDRDASIDDFSVVGKEYLIHWITNNLLK